MLALINVDVDTAFYLTNHVRNKQLRVFIGRVNSGEQAFRVTQLILYCLWILIFLCLSSWNTLQVHQKELLLQDLIREGVFGPEQRRRVGPACSRRIYRIFMAQNGNLKTDDVEQGADRFDDSD